MRKCPVWSKSMKIGVRAGSYDDIFAGSCVSFCSCDDAIFGDMGYACVMEIITIDISEWKLELFESFGRTKCLMETRNKCELITLIKELDGCSRAATCDADICCKSCESRAYNPYCTRICRHVFCLFYTIKICEEERYSKKIFKKMHRKRHVCAYPVHLLYAKYYIRSMQKYYEIFW